MQLCLLFAFFANVFADDSLRGSYQQSHMDADEINNIEVFHWKEFSNFQDRFKQQQFEITNLNRQMQFVCNHPVLGNT